MQNGKLLVVGKGKTANTVLCDEINISDSKYTESIENMVNIVRVYDDFGKQIDEAKNVDWIKKFGKFQKIYKKEEDKNPKSAAQSILQGIEQTASVSALGNISCVSGNVVNSEAKRYIEECLNINPHIKGIADFNAVFESDMLTLDFTVLSDFGEVKIHVLRNYL